MNEEEKQVASILLAQIANSVEDTAAASGAIARYQDFVQACNFRRRVLVNGWSELKSLEDISGDEASEAHKTYTSTPSWWVVRVAVSGGKITSMAGPYKTELEAAECLHSLSMGSSDNFTLVAGAIP